MQHTMFVCMHDDAVYARSYIIRCVCACARIYIYIYIFNCACVFLGTVKFRKHTRSSMCVLCMYICMRVCKQRVHSHTAN
jgi:hypothetical protein